MNESEQLDAVHAMQAHGGEFVRCVARCWFAADEMNRRILVNAFDDVFEKYLAVSEALTAARAIARTPEAT